MMDDRHVDKLENQVSKLRGVLRELGDDEPFDEFITVIHKPGWTTIAEWKLVEGGLESMTALATALNELKLSVFAGARAVGGEDASQ
jgi:hypothetical protein